METTTVRAVVLWFNDAKGYGLVRAEDVDLDDITVEAAVVENRQHLLIRGALIEVTVQEALTGLAARSVRFLNEPARGE
jgi:cold shock CspA family protein